MTSVATKVSPSHSSAVCSKDESRTLARELAALPDVGATYYLLIHLERARRRLQQEVLLWEERRQAAEGRLAEVEGQVAVLRRWLGYPPEVELRPWWQCPAGKG